MSQPTPSLDSRINGTFENRFIGQATTHRWKDGVYELEIDGECREYTFHQLTSLCDRKGWDWEENGHSNSVLEIYEEKHRYWCSECDEKAMYDDNRGEFYCPQCE